MKVLFRMRRHGASSAPDRELGVFAVFPAETNGSGEPYLCTGYAWSGAGTRQHISVDLLNDLRLSVPAKPEDYAEIERELRQMGYELQVAKRTSGADTLNRLAQIEERKRAAP